MTRTDTCPRPPEGWAEPTDSLSVRDGHIRFTTYDRAKVPFAPERDGYEAFFVAVHGNNFTTWTYRPVPEGGTR